MLLLSHVSWVVLRQSSPQSQVKACSCCMTRAWKTTSKLSSFWFKGGTSWFLCIGNCASQSDCRGNSYDFVPQGAGTIAKMSVHPSRQAYVEEANAEVSTSSFYLKQHGLDSHTVYIHECSRSPSIGASSTWRSDSASERKAHHAPSQTNMRTNTSFAYDRTKA